ncbi:centrosomal protein of 68 kDa [Stegostoma tigrinum]|uniref:centrosomal protein of 68 kDa n=1 Tax=Stegostoma tigrinum TaxID=3053191 RepID=UPI00202B61AF|nr:centrosomal protein of 68 kDa [Stegostoma tigrinum]XP_048392537.1 centrosomal protein of 68 kDa [Stegostoma tigrinum]XP_048392538.1 centrosomal protein of 68 kDa [Stegostoma tigrinum]
MQDQSKRYSHLYSGYMRGTPSERQDDSGMFSLLSESLHSLYPTYQPKSSSLSLSRVYEPGGRSDPLMTRSVAGIPRSLKSLEVEKPLNGRCLSTPRYSTCLDTSAFSQCIPQRKATLSSHNVNVGRYTPLGQTATDSVGLSVSSFKALRDKEVTPCFSEFWAMRQADSNRPFRDRTSPDWDPDEEYQALLDFTYPLRPGHISSRDNFDDDDDDDMTSDSYLKDSGIMDDSLIPSLSNTTITNTSLSLPAYQSNTSSAANITWGHSSYREDHAVTPYCSSSPPHLHSQPSYWLSEQPPKAGIIPNTSVDSPARNKTEGLINQAVLSEQTMASSVIDSSFLSGSSNEESSKPLLSGKDPGGFILTTQVLTLNKEWESEEEFLTLPYKLNELEALAQQLEKLSVHWESKSAKVASGMREGTDPKSGSAKCNLTEQDSSTEAAQSSCQLGVSPRKKPKSPQYEDIIADLKRANDFIRKLGTWSGSQLLFNQPLEQAAENNVSLLAHIQSFSSKLEEMVQWLYDVAETTDNWIPPQPTMDSIKASLDKCMAFRNDIKEHQELTASVLNSGEHLLQSMSSTTPVLKETLELISRQSKQLNGHAAHLYFSVLAAMNKVKDDLETKQQEFESAGVEGQSVLMPSGLEEHDAANHVNMDHPV